MCYDKAQTPCLDGLYTPGYCLGGINVQCCILTLFFAYLYKIYDLAVDYIKEKGGKKDPNELVMEWLRYWAYNGVQWGALIGYYDEEWI